MEGIIDFHTPVFPDEIAERAIIILEREGNIKAKLNRKVSSLLSSMDAKGIEKSTVCSIATKPSQFDSILSWSKKIRLGTDSPWTDQDETLLLLKGLGLSEEREKMILRENSQKLLN